MLFFPLSVIFYWHGKPCHEILQKNSSDMSLARNVKWPPKARGMGPWWLRYVSHVSSVSSLWLEGRVPAWNKRGMTGGQALSWPAVVNKLEVTALPRSARLGALCRSTLAVAGAGEKMRLNAPTPFLCLPVPLLQGCSTSCLSGCLRAKLRHLCPTPCDPMDCSPPGSSVRGILQARILKWVAMPSSRESSQPRDRTQVSCFFCVGRRILYH